MLFKNHIFSLYISYKLILTSIVYIPAIITYKSPNPVIIDLHMPLKLRISINQTHFQMTTICLSNKIFKWKVFLNLTEMTFLKYTVKVQNHTQKNFLVIVIFILPGFSNPSPSYLDGITYPKVRWCPFKMITKDAKGIT